VSHTGAVNLFIAVQVNSLPFSIEFLAQDFGVAKGIAGMQRRKVIEDVQDAKCHVV